MNPLPGIVGQTSETTRKWAKLVTEVWADDSLKKRLMDNPASVLQEHGVAVPAGWSVHIVEPPDKVLCLVLPPKPVDVTEVTEDELKGVVGGMASRYKSDDDDDTLSGGRK